MLTPRFSLTADRNTTVPLRFDDPDFIEALERDASDEQDDVKTPLARLLGVKRAADFDFSPYTEINFTLNARPAVGGKADKDVYTDARKGEGFDVAAFNAKRWSLWVLGASVSEEVTWPLKDGAAFAKLSSTDRGTREAGYNDLEARLQSVLTCRLRVHIDAAGRPADRDPGKAVTEAAM